MSDPLTDPYLAVYDDCSAVSLITEEVPFNANTVSTTVLHSETLDGQMFVRVGSQDGNEGNFNITVAVSN